METAIKSLPNSMGNKKRGKFIIIAALLFFLVPNLALAIPNLQIWSPQGEYDTITETWIIPHYDYDLWVIGAHLEVNDVKLAFAVPDDEYEDGSIQVTWHNPSIPDYGSATPYDQKFYDEEDKFTLTFSEDESLRVGEQLDYTDYRVEYEGNDNDPNPTTYGFGSGTPLAGDGAQIPPHGVFPTDFYEYFIGDFGTDGTVENYIPGDELGDEACGEIKIFDISVSGYSWVDIGAYDHVILSNTNVKYVFTPFSHDGASTPAPEPATMLLLGSGLIGLGWFGRRKTKKMGLIGSSAKSSFETKDVT